MKVAAVVVLYLAELVCCICHPSGHAEEEPATGNHLQASLVKSTNALEKMTTGLYNRAVAAHAGWFCTSLASDVSRTNDMVGSFVAQSLARVSLDGERIGGLRQQVHNMIENHAQEIDRLRERHATEIQALEARHRVNIDLLENMTKAGIEAEKQSLDHREMIFRADYDAKVRLLEADLQVEKNKMEYVWKCIAGMLTAVLSLCYGLTGITFDIQARCLRLILSGHGGSSDGRSQVLQEVHVDGPTRPPTSSNSSPSQTRESPTRSPTSSDSSSSHGRFAPAVSFRQRGSHARQAMRGRRVDSPRDAD